MPASLKNQSRGDRWTLLLCVAVLTVGRIVSHPESAACLVDPPHQSLLTTAAAWNVPLTGLAAASALYQADTQYVLCALAAAATICLFCVRQSSINGLLLLGLVAVLPPQDLICGLAIAAAALGSSGKTRTIGRAVVLLIAACCSLEIGLIGLICVVMDLADIRSQRRPAVTSLLLTLFVIAAGCVALPGFGNAVCRPFTVWRWQDCELLPHLASSFQRREWLTTGVLTTATGLGLLAQRDIATVRTAAIVVLFMIGLMCGFYAGPALAAIVALTWRIPAVSPPQAQPGDRRGLPVAITVILLCGMMLHSGVSARWTAGQSELNFSDMGQGRLLLGDLSGSSKWKVTAANLKLVIDDRWDVCGSHYEALDGHIQDLYFGRQEVYVRGDGSWGGYRGFLDELRPSLFVVPISMTAPIRRVVMDPDWNVCGIDETNVCFAHADYGSVYRARRLLDQVLNLEWPNARSTYQLDGLIRYDRKTSAVARTLAAMRFPNAALRLLDETSVTDADTIAFCWLEIANRTLRQTGRIPVAELTVVHGLRSVVSDAMAKDTRSTISAWTTGAATNSPADSVRLLLATGQHLLAKQKLAEVPDADERSFLGILLTHSGGNITKMASKLESEASQWSTGAIRAEALCAAGTLHLATGQPDRALAAFLASQQALTPCDLDGYRELNIRSLYGTR